LPICPSCGYDYRTANEATSQAPPPLKASAPSRLLFVVAALVVLVVVVAAVGLLFNQVQNGPHATSASITNLASQGVQATSSLHTVTGSYVLTDTSGFGISASGGTCKGTGGYADIIPGLPVILKDQNGTVIGSTALGPGTGTSTSCTFSFSMQNVPDTATFYVISVSHRGDVSLSHDELEADGWFIGLTLGT
jgi:hypothetical protein